MPDTTTITEVPPPVVSTVVETETVFPTPTALPEPVEPPPPPVMDPELSESMRTMVDSINSVNAQLEGTETGPLVLDPDQFGAIGFALALVVALLVVLVVVSVRR